MSYKPTYIADLQSGLVRNKEAYLIPQDAFPDMTNAYIFRGRIKRRLGYDLLGRLQRNLGTLAPVAAGNYSTIIGTNVFNVFIQLGLAATEPNAELVIATVAHPITIAFGAPINQTITINNNTGIMNVIGAGPITNATINYATGVISITAAAAVGPAAATAVLSYYPMLPCMDLSVWEKIEVNNEDLIAFDTKYAYIFNNATQEFQEWIPGTVWNGTDFQFFWTTNYWQSAGNIGLFWATNNIGPVRDPIRYTDGLVWTLFAPLVNAAGTRLEQALILFPYKDRLLAFNTWEGANLGAATQFPQRVRWSQNGDPTDQVNGWLEDAPGRGGFIDAPTNENIVSVANVRDVLIVGFERSTWQLRYTGNELLPFVWERINSDLGIESTFSPVTLDDRAYGIGQAAIQVSNGNFAERADLQIPDEVFNFHNDNEGQLRIHGIRDFFNELIYWTFPNDDQNGKFPNRVLVYNYRNNSYSFFDDSFTCYSQWQRSFDRVWANYIQIGIDEWVNQPYPWSSPTNQSLINEIVAGNQQGYVLLLNQFNANGRSLSIRAITAGNPGQFTIPNHNLSTGDVIRITGALGTIQGIFNAIADTLNNRTYEVIVINANTVSLRYIASDGTLQQVNTIGIYIGGAEIQYMNRIDVRSKKFNALEQGLSIKLGFADILADVTSNGEFTFNVYADYDDSNPINQTNDGFFNSRVLTSIEPFQIASQTKSWHRTFCPSRSQFYQFQITMNNAQLFDYAIASSDLVIHALILWAEYGGRLI